MSSDRSKNLPTRCGFRLRGAAVTLITSFRPKARTSFGTSSRSSASRRNGASYSQNHLGRLREGQSQVRRRVPASRTRRAHCSLGIVLIRSEARGALEPRSPTCRSRQLGLRRLEDRTDDGLAVAVHAVEHARADALPLEERGDVSFQALEDEDLGGKVDHGSAGLGGALVAGAGERLVLAAIGVLQTPGRGNLDVDVSGQDERESSPELVHVAARRRRRKVHPNLAGPVSLADDSMGGAEGTNTLAISANAAATRFCRDPNTPSRRTRDSRCRSWIRHPRCYLRVYGKLVSRRHVPTDVALEDARVYPKRVLRRLRPMPLVHYRSFTAITGPKIDDWLVKTVGLLVASMGTALLVGGRNGELSSVSTLGASSVASAVGRMPPFASANVADMSHDRTLSRCSAYWAIAVSNRLASSSLPAVAASSIRRRQLIALALRSEPSRRDAEGWRRDHPSRLASPAVRY
jgi:hypothetical protein